MPAANRSAHAAGCEMANAPFTSNTHSAAVAAGRPARAAHRRALPVRGGIGHSNLKSTSSCRTKPSCSRAAFSRAAGWMGADSSLTVRESRAFSTRSSRFFCSCRAMSLRSRSSLGSPRESPSEIALRQTEAANAPSTSFLRGDSLAGIHADATPRPQWRKKTSARLERLLQVVHQQLVDAAGDLLEQLLAVRQRIPGAALVSAAPRPLRGVDAGGCAETLPVRRDAEVGFRRPQAQGLHRRRAAVAVLRAERLAFRGAHVEVRAPLLQDVRELVRDELLSLDGRSVEPAGREEDVVFDRHRLGVEPARDLRGARTGVDADAGELALEERLHLRERRDIEAPRLVEARAERDPLRRQLAVDAVSALRGLEHARERAVRDLRLAIEPSGGAADPAREAFHVLRRALDARQRVHPPAAPPGDAGGEVIEA